MSREIDLKIAAWLGWHGIVKLDDYVAWSSGSKAEGAKECVPYFSSDDNRVHVMLNHLVEKGYTYTLHYYRNIGHELEVFVEGQHYSSFHSRGETLANAVSSAVALLIDS